MANFKLPYTGEQVTEYLKQIADNLFVKKNDNTFVSKTDIIDLEHGGLGSTNLGEALKILGVEMQPHDEAIIRNKTYVPSASVAHLWYIPALKLCYFEGMVAPRSSDYPKGKVLPLWDIKSPYRPFVWTALTHHSGSSVHSSSVIDPNKAPENAQVKLYTQGMGNGWYVYIQGIWRC